MDKNIVIIHYNTPRLTECLVRSINLFVKDAIIYIFDNSDKDPFTAKFDNVTVIDNTKGQIINFDKWLENYPNRFKSTEATRTFGSAKHCYSVEKCIELVDKNFILLDSDVLLKRDISNLYDNRVAYIGEIVKQPYVPVKRVLPFVCFINVDMLKEYGKHYFDDNYMHGLHNDKINEHADWYDTGAGFYMNTLDLPHMDIICEDYVEHYGHGSWFKKGYTYTYTADEWLIMNKKYWGGVKNKKVVYTCITGGYDGLLEPTYVTPGYDYICFTDSVSISSSTWDIRPLPEEVANLSQIKKQRYVKLNPHKILGEYDLSVWVDGNITVKGNLDKLIEKTVVDDISIYVPTHPMRSCIYEESRAVIRMKKDSNDIVDKQMDRYRAEGFPTHYGLLQSNILIRKHNEADCIRLMEAWCDEVMNGSHRDQLSFNYSCWKNEDIKVSYLDKKIYNSEWFFWKTKHLVNKTFPQSEKRSIDESKKRFKEIMEMAKVNRTRRINTNDIKIY